MGAFSEAKTEYMQGDKEFRSQGRGKGTNE